MYMNVFDGDDNGDRIMTIVDRPVECLFYVLATQSTGFDFHN